MPMSLSSSSLPPESSSSTVAPEKKSLLTIYMEYNKDEDYDGAKKFIHKAQKLYPKLDGLKQVLMMIDVYKSASNGGEEADWYGILGVDPLADDEVVKKQYKKLALLLHPDKNKLNGAEGAFKLVLEAWCMLSDKVKRTSYDQRRKSKEAKTEIKKPNPHKPASSGIHKPPNPCKPACNNGNQNARDSVDPSVGATSNNKLASWIKKRLNIHKPTSSNGSRQNARDGVDRPSVGARSNKLVSWIKKRLNPHKPASSEGNKNARDVTVWKICNRCNDDMFYFNTVILCLHCGQPLIATEKTPGEKAESGGTYSNRFSASFSFHWSYSKVQV